MNLQKPTQSRLGHCVFILWGDNFEEEVVTIFATALRRAGLYVKIVGLAGLQASGIHGVVLSADLTLGQALLVTQKTVAIVVPCNVAILQRFEDDPRLRDFFRQAVEPHVRLIVDRAEVITHSSLQHLAVTAEQVSCYAEAVDLVEYAQTIAIALSSLIAV